jgi:2-polyprenyl-6-methoxyphenol hydroxylase-like FAD-dependent oxidoreductase
MSAAFEEYEVVVVGAGPAGLASAATLGAYGVETLVIDRRPAASVLPRATVASTATMELLRRWGLEDAAWERSLEVEWQAWACPTLARAGDGEAIEVGLPTRAQAALVSPTRPACIGQDELEPLLERHVRSLPSVRVDREVAVVSLERADDGGQMLTLEDPARCRRLVRAGYVIGADGLRSRVRSQLGIATDGSDDLETRWGMLLRAPLWDLVGEHRYGIYFMTEEQEGKTFIPAGRPDRWGFATDGAEEPGAGEAIEWVRRAAGDPSLPVEIERMMPVTFGIALAERFRSGSAFLIGDAAHRVTPRGGTGMNTAIRDGFDLGWKLGWVLRGWADERLLESYEHERRPVAEHNTMRSTRSDGSILGNTAGLAADIGGRVAHVWVERHGGLVSTIDLLGDGLTLFVGPEHDGVWPGGEHGVAPIAVERLDAIAARALGLGPGGALLARPDGYPLAVSNDGSPEASALEARRRSQQPQAAITAPA